MSRNIKGITIEINGDTTGLDKALSDVNSSANKTQSELRDVNKLLKLDPGNTELIAQKQKLLSQAISQTGEKLGTLKEAQAQVEAQFKKGEIGEEQYRVFQREIVSTESTLKGYESQLSTAKTSQQDLSQSTERLKTYFKSTGTEIDDFKGILGTRLVEAIKNGTASSDSMDRALQKIAKESGIASGDIGKLEQILDSMSKSGANVDVTKQKISELRGATSKATSGISGLSETARNTKLTAVAQGAQQAGENVKNFGSNALGAAGEYDSGMQKAIRTSGATGKSADDLKQSFKDMADKVGGSWDDLGETIGAVSGQFNVSGNKLTKLTGTIREFGLVTNTDGKTAAENAAAAMKAYDMSADQVPATLDAVTSASQHSKISASDLLSVITTNASIFKAMGLNAGEAATLVGNLGGAGISQTSAMQALNKSNVNFTKSGKDMTTGLKDFQSEVKNSTDKQKLMTDATNLFGSKAGPAMVNAIKDGKLNLGELSKQSNATKGDLHKNFGDSATAAGQYATAQNGIKKAMAEIGKAIQATLVPILKALTPIIQKVGKFFQKLPGPVKQVIVVIGILTTAFAIMAPAIVALSLSFDQLDLSLLPIIAVIVGISVAIVLIITAIKNWGNIVKWLKGVWSGIKSFFAGVWNGIKSVISGVINGIKSVITSVWNAIKSVTSSVFNSVRSTASSIWNGIKSAISSVVNGIKSTVSNVWNGIKSVTTSVWNGIKSAITGPIQAAKGVISGIVDSIKRLFNFKLKFPKIDIPHIPLPHFNLSGSFNPLKGKIPSIGIDWYAKGGVFTKPTLFANNGGFSGVGEAGPEAALPLNAETLGGIGKGIAEATGGLGGDTINVTVQVLADTSAQTIKKLTDAVTDGITRAQNSKARAIGG